MKKLLLCIVALVAAFGVVKANDFITIQSDGWFSGTYPDFSYGNKQVVYLQNEHYGDDPVQSFTILNEEFATVKTIEITKEVIKYSDQWGNHIRMIPALDLTIIDLLHDPECDAIISQTLFNDDETFEYVIPITAIGKDYDGYVCPIMIGFKVMDENGKMLKEVNFPDGLYHTVVGGDEADILLVHGKKYIYIRHIHDASGGEYILLYEIKKGSSMFNAPQIIPAHASVNPTAPRRSERVNVTFNEPLSNSCTISLVNASGRVVYTRNVASGASEAAIETSRLAPGVYVVNINDGHSVRENSKIIIR